MTAPTENEDWILERGGDIVEKKTRSGLSSLDDLEHVIYCLWVADYMMRNAGDLANSEDMYPAFQSEAAMRARKLGLRLTAQAFSLTPEQLQAQYFDKFDAICNEIKASNAPGPGR